MANALKTEKIAVIGALAEGASIRGIDKGERFVTVLELPPVESPQTAVRVAVVSDIKRNRKC